MLGYHNDADISIFLKINNISDASIIELWVKIKVVLELCH